MGSVSRRCAFVGSASALVAALCMGGAASAGAGVARTPVPPPPVASGPHSNCPAALNGKASLHANAVPSAAHADSTASEGVCTHLINDTSPSAEKAKAGLIAADRSAAHTRTVDQDKKSNLENAASPQAIPIEPYPEYCPTSNGQVYTFEDACGWQDYEVVLVQLNTGKVLGTLDYFMRDYSYWERSLLDFIHQIQISPYTGTGEGTTPGYWKAIKGYTGCWITTPSGVTCKSTEEDFATQDIQVETKSAAGVTSFLTTIQTGSESLFSHYLQWGIWYTGPDPVVNNASWENDTLITYCDNNLSGVTYGGCKAPTDKWAPTYTLSLAKYPTLAKAIQAAQAKGVPGSRHSGKWLTRTTNASIQTQNRTAACPDTWKRPPGSYSCDEYPGASTYQGAAYNPSAGITFAYCKNPYLSQTTRSPKWESCFVPDSQENSSEGGLRNGFWTAYRTLDNDRFWEEVSS